MSGKYRTIVADPPGEGRVSALIFDALVAFERADRYGQCVLLDLLLDIPCSECGGSTFCPDGCPMHTCRLTGEARYAFDRFEPIRDHKYVRGEDGMWDPVLVSGKECDACTIYGTCMSCGPGGEGKERRAATRKGSAYLVDTQSHLAYCRAGFQMADPIRLPVARVERAIQDEEEAPTLFALSHPTQEAAA